MHNQANKLRELNFTKKVICFLLDVQVIPPVSYVKNEDLTPVILD